MSDELVWKNVNQFFIRYNKIKIIQMEFVNYLKVLRNLFKQNLYFSNVFQYAFYIFFYSCQRNMYNFFFKLFKKIYVFPGKPFTFKEFPDFFNQIFNHLNKFLVLQITTSL